MALATNLDGSRGLSESRKQPILENRWVRRVAVFAVIAIAAGGFVQGYRFATPGESPVVYEGGALVAAGELESVLYNPFLSESEEGPKVSDEFRNEAGQVCRRFADGPVTGLACRAGGDWRVYELKQD